MTHYGPGWRPAPSERDHLAELEDRQRRARDIARAELSPYVRRALAHTLPASDRTGTLRRMDYGR